MEIKFTNECPASRFDEVIEFISGPRLWIPRTDYPDFNEWAGKVHQELHKGTKRVMVSMSLHEVIGVIIYQRHKTRPDTLELKNLTVRPEARGRYIASFLLRNTEIEGGAEFSAHYVVCDAKVHNVAVRLFLFKQHYTIIGKDDLYSLNAGEDLMYQKSLWSNNAPFLQRM